MECKAPSRGRVVITRADDTPWNQWSASATYFGKPRNEFRFTSPDKTTVEMKLYAESHQPQVVIFDADKLDLVRRFTWYQCIVHDGVYARTTTPGHRVLKMHTLLTGFSYVDHVNRNGLDNRLKNLRESNAKDNMNNKRLQINNTSGVNGVCDVNKRNMYEVQWTNSGVSHKKCFSYGPKSLLTKEHAFEKAKSYRRNIDAITGCTNGHEVDSESKQASDHAAESKRQRLV